MRAGCTADTIERGHLGRLRGRSAWILTARSGLQVCDAREADVQEPSPQEEVGTWFQSGDGDFPGEDLDRRGGFSARDREEIHTLREGQLVAILAGDAMGIDRSEVRIQPGALLLACLKPSGTVAAGATC